MKILIHPQFRLNGQRPSQEELANIATKLHHNGSDYERAIGQFLLDWLSPTPTVNVKTSGSTGTPKTITLKKEHMANSAMATGKALNLGAGDSALLCLSANYIAGKMMLVRALVLGLRLDYMEPSSDPLTNLTKPYDFCAIVPLQLENSPNEAIEKIKILIVGGGIIAPELVLRVRTVSIKIFETYGMTETITHVALKQISGASLGVISPYFSVLPNITIEKDDRGCLVIGAPTIADQKIITNDMVKIHSKTEFRWLGRYDNIINSGGVKLIPEAIEEKLAAFIESRFFVVGMPDARLGQKLVLIVEGGINEKRLRYLIKEYKVVERFEAPKEVIPILKFAETPTGKIDRKATLLLIG